MKKILHLCLLGTVTDGFTYQDNLLPKYHKRLGYEVDLITSQYIFDKNGKIVKTKQTEYTNSDGIHIYRIPIKNDRPLLSKFKKYEKLYETIEKSNPDIIFIHGCQTLDIYTIIKYLKNNKKTVYVDNHSDFKNSASNWISKNILHKIIWKRCAQKINPYVTKFYGVLPARVDFLKNVYGLSDDKCELLELGLDDDAIKNLNKIDIRKEKEIHDNEFIIVSGGKIDHNKYEIVNLMKIINKLKNLNVKLFVFGSVDENIKEEFEQNISEKVIYLGWLTSEEVYKCFASADLIVFPGLHSVYWEQAVAIGTPILCRYIEGFTHIDIGGNVEYIKSTRIEELNEKIEQIIMNKNNKYTNMLKSAKSDLKNNFLYSGIAEKSLK